MTRTPTTEDLEFYNKALGNPANNRGGPTLTGSTGSARPRSKAKTRARSQDDFDYASDQAAYTSWMANDMPGPEGYTSWMSISMMPRDMTRYAYELSLNKVEEMLRELEPDERQLIEACMAFKGNDMQAARFLGLPRITYRDRLNKAREHAKVIAARFYEWGDEPTEFNDKLNEVRSQLRNEEEKRAEDTAVAQAVYNRVGSIRTAAKELEVSVWTVRRLLDAA